MLLVVAKGGAAAWLTWAGFFRGDVEQAGWQVLCVWVCPASRHAQCSPLPLPPVYDSTAGQAEGGQGAGVAQQEELQGARARLGLAGTCRAGQLAVLGAPPLPVRLLEEARGQGQGSWSAAGKICIMQVCCAAGWKGLFMGPWVHGHPGLRCAWTNAHPPCVPQGGWVKEGRPRGWRLLLHAGCVLTSRLMGSRQDLWLVPWRALDAPATWLLQYNRPGITQRSATCQEGIREFHGTALEQRTNPFRVMPSAAQRKQRS